jgi:ubiquinone/menaquinone biosynthesis C-methylase UbiE
MAHGHDVDGFDHWASTYDRHWMQRIMFGPIQRSVLQLAAEQVSRPGAILDVGCGTGKLLKSAETQFPGAKLVGIDAAIEMVKYAQTSNPTGTIQFQQGMAEEVPFPNAYLTWCLAQLPNQTRGVAEVARVLTSGGRWLLADFVASGFMRPVRRLLRLHQFPERADLQSMFFDAGLKVVAERRVPGLAGQIAVMAIGAEPS